MVRALLFGAVLAVATVAGSDPAAACTIAAGGEYELLPSEQRDDQQAPGPVQVLEVDVHRAISSDSASCNDLGFIGLRLADVIDDRTPPEEIGYELTLTQGRPPGNLVIPEGPMYWGPNRISLHWSDWPTHDDAFSMTLAIRAVDRGGNQGPATEVTIRDSAAGGCAITTTETAPTWLLAILLLATRRRSPTRLTPRDSAPGRAAARLTPGDSAPGGAAARLTPRDSAPGGAAARLTPRDSAPGGAAARR